MKLPSLAPRRVVVWWMASAFPLAAIVAVGAYLSYHYHELLQESRDRIDDTYETLDMLHRLFGSLEDAETGQRGFIITGDAAYLAPFDTALTTAPPIYLALRSLIKDSEPSTGKCTGWSS